MSLTPGDVGYYHNESLRLTQDLWGQGGDYWTNESLTNLMKDRMAETYPNGFASVTQDQITNILNNDQMKEFFTHTHDDKATLIRYIRGALDKKLYKGEISRELHRGLYVFFDVNKDYETSLAAINAINMSALSTKEQDMVNATKSIYENSHSYWVTYSSKNTKKRWLTHNQVGGIVDAAAGLFAIGATGGWATGAVVFIAAAASSAWWD